MEDKLQSSECAEKLKALADQERLKIIQALQAGPLSVSDLALLLGVELANVSHHLKVLRHARLVQSQKEGKYVYYSLHPDIFRRGADGRLILVAELGCCRLDLDGCE